ncbi:MAG: hypothetical protein ABSE53_01630 [Terracidiphilus sp.]|jgi:hypothetical protein
MAIIVVGGGGRGAGKTALVCGLMRALPEISWTAIKVTTHEHGKETPIWEETEPGLGSDTARYLAAGARRAFLVTAGEDALGPIVQQILWQCLPPVGASPVGAIFESNSVLRHLRPDVCLCAATSPWIHEKPSYDLVSQRMDAMVELAGHDHIIEAEKITFRLASLERVSPTMLEWLREQLGDRLP